MDGGVEAFLQGRGHKGPHGVPTKFPADALAEAQKLPAIPSEADFKGREDLRATPFVTIDGATARDFDDAVFVARKGKGYELWVAIADVAHYVPMFSPSFLEVKEVNDKTGLSQTRYLFSKLAP